MKTHNSKIDWCLLHNSVSMVETIELYILDCEFYNM